MADKMLRPWQWVYAVYVQHIPIPVLTAWCNTVTSNKGWLCLHRLLLQYNIHCTITHCPWQWALFSNDVALKNCLCTHHCTSLHLHCILGCKHTWRTQVCWCRKHLHGKETEYYTHQYLHKKQKIIQQTFSESQVHILLQGFPWQTKCCNEFLITYFAAH